MNLIAKCADSGFPREILIPVCPPFVPIHPAGAETEGSIGKSPARFVDDKWVRLDGWRGNVAPAVQDASDAAGCNVGLVLGKHIPALDNSTLAMIDIDLAGDMNPSMVHLCTLIEQHIARMVASLQRPGQEHRYVLWCRKTVAYRAAILVRLPGDLPPGKKHVLNISGYPAENKKTSKIEMMCDGQQMVIAGLHHSHSKIAWYRSDMPDAVFAVPSLSLDSVPIFSTWEDCINLVQGAVQDALNDPANPMGTATIGSKKPIRNSSPVSAMPLLPRDAAAPSVQMLVNLLNAAPNPDSNTREDYTAFMLAAAGARKGMGKITIEEDDAIAAAAANWAAKWEGGEASSYEDELNKWEMDWSTRKEYYSGWRHLCHLAATFGCDMSPFMLAEARDSFEPGEDTRLDMPEWNAPAKHLATDKTELSEFWFATKFAEFANGQMAYLAEEQRWVMWDTSRGGWFSEGASASMRGKLRQFIEYIVDRKGGISNSDAVGLSTSAKVSNIERLLRDQLLKPRSLFDQAAWVIQDPQFAYNLRTGEKISKHEQRLYMDTRYTGVVAREGATPMWDNLISHLCEEDAATTEWLKHYLAYSLIGDPKAHKMLYIWGTGMNGKSTLLHIMSEILGGYAGTIDRDVWLQRTADKHPVSLYKIRGLRLAMTSEMPPNESWNESRLKAVTGQDVIEARPLFKDPCNFKCNAALIMVGQTIPIFKKIDNSISRRITIIGTAQSPAKPDSELGRKIIDFEGSAILYDLIRRCKGINTSGILLPELSKQMKAETNEYFAKADTFFSWVSTEVTFDNNDDTLQPLSTFLDRYTAFLKRAAGGDTLGQMVNVDQKGFIDNMRRFGARIKDRSGKALLLHGAPAVMGCKLKIALAA